jgi:hypothetical protein
MREVVWKALAWSGIERLTLVAGRAGVVAKGQLVGDPDGAPIGVQYEIRCDAAWTFHRVIVHGLAGGRLDLTRGPEGTWEANGHPLPALRGCVDVDLSLTPFTNTLPIRRLGLAPGQTVDLDVAYITLPDLVVVPARQRYTRQHRNGPGALYQYESGTFRAAVAVDDDGLVTTYEGLWEALPVSSGR